MKKGEFKELVKDYFTFTRQERTGMLVLGGVLLFSMLLYHVAGWLVVQRSADPSGADDFLESLKELEAMRKEGQGRLFAFDPNTVSAEALDSLAIPRALRSNLLRYREKGGRFRKPEELRKLYGMNDSLFALLSPYIRLEETPRPGREVRVGQANPARFFFSPATVTGEELTRLGFNAYQRQNLLKYRDRGGTFRRKTDLLKIYGIDSAFYREVEPWVAMEEERAAEAPVKEAEAAPSLVEINSADSAQLVALPGIGPSFAGRIIRYRSLLGGYYDPSQLLEVYGMTAGHLARFGRLITVDTGRLQPLRLNFAGEGKLGRHPYISDGQAESIVAIRSKEGPFDSPARLLELKVFSDSSYRKIRPYLTCR